MRTCASPIKNQCRKEPPRSKLSRIIIGESWSSCASAEILENANSLNAAVLLGLLAKGPMTLDRVMECSESFFKTATSFSDSHLRLVRLGLIKRKIDVDQAILSFEITDLGRKLLSENPTASNMEVVRLYTERVS